MWGRYTHPKASPLITAGKTKCCDIRLCNPLSSEKCIQSRSNLSLLLEQHRDMKLLPSLDEWRWWFFLFLMFFLSTGHSCITTFIFLSHPHRNCRGGEKKKTSVISLHHTALSFLSYARLQNPTCAASIPPRRWLTCASSNKSPNKRCICQLGDTGYSFLKLLLLLSPFFLTDISKPQLLLSACFSSARKTRINRGRRYQERRKNEIYSPHLDLQESSNLRVSMKYLKLLFYLQCVAPDEQSRPLWRNASLFDWPCWSAVVRWPVLLWPFKAS